MNNLSALGILLLFISYGTEASISTTRAFQFTCDVNYIRFNANGANGVPSCVKTIGRSNNFKACVYEIKNASSVNVKLEIGGTAINPTYKPYKMFLVNGNCFTFSNTTSGYFSVVTSSNDIACQTKNCSVEVDIFFDSA